MWEDARPFLLITDEYTLESVRGTDDVDLVIHLTGTADWYRLEEQLKPLGFKNTGQDNVTCRLRLGDLKVDFMPTAAEVLGFSNTWFSSGLNHSTYHQLPSGTRIKVFAAPWFLAAKLQAFEGRGNGDVLMSNDIEDIIALVDGREELIEEIAHAPHDLQLFVAERVSILLTDTSFQAVVQSTAQGPEREKLIYDRLEHLANPVGRA